MKFFGVRTFLTLMDNPAIPFSGNIIYVNDSCNDSCLDYNNFWYEMKLLINGN